MNALNQDLITQHNSLLQIIDESPLLQQVFAKTILLNIDNYYVGGGCIVQTVWNHLSGNAWDHGIKDIDLVYYDAIDTSYEAEDQVIRKAEKLFRNLPFELDVKNQARIHLWYEKMYGFPIKPYKSLEEAINTWPTTVTAIGVRRTKDHWKVYAPYGLNDLFGMIARANKMLISQEVFEQKAQRWASLWTKLTIIPWEK